MGLDAHKLAEEFFGAGQISHIAPFGNGHINQTFIVGLRDGREAVAQRINTHVFPEPAKLMENIERVCVHLRHKNKHHEDSRRRHLQVWNGPDGRPFLQDSQGNHWRAYDRITQVSSYDSLTEASQAYHVGSAFAEFQALLSDLPSPRLHDVIPDFHHTPKRFQRFLQVLENDSHKRRAEVQREIDFILQRQESLGRLVDKLEAGILPERITHNDTKLNNLLFDHSGQTALCVVDLDTVMPGLVHYDFGDMIRTATNRAAEDEKDPANVSVDTEIFRHLAQGYVEAGSAFLTPAEKEELVFSGILMTLEVGIRFLTDHLEGDPYFRVHHPGHNLQRTRAQFALVEALERARPEWEDILGTLLVRNHGFQDSNRL